MTVVDGRGKVLVISDQENLKSFKINLGLLGIVVDITFYTVPLYKVKAHNYVTSDDVLMNGVAINWAKTLDSVTLFWFPAFKEVVVSNLTFVSVATKGTAKTNSIVPSSNHLFNMVTSISKEIAFDLTTNECAIASALGYTILHVIEFYTQLSLWTVAPLIPPIHTDGGLLLKNPAVGYPHKMLSAICSDKRTILLGQACVWAHGPNNLTILDNEFNLALSDLPAFIKTVKDIVKKTPTAFSLQGLYLRFSGKSNDYMSTSFGRDSVHVEFYLWKRDDPYNDASGNLAGYQTILQTLAKRFKARSHWGKSGLVYHNREMLDLKLDTYARGKFVTAMKKFDPNGVFVNNFGRRILETGNSIDMDPLTTRCAVLDNCFCSKDSDCGETQICTSLSGYDYHVCKTKNIVPETIFDKKILPPPLGVVDWLITVVLPWGYDNTETVPFFVIPRFDLNEFPHLREPVRAEANKTFGCWESEPLHLYNILPCQGFIPGDRIPFNLEVRNDSDVSICGAHVKLIEKIVYHAYSPQSATRESHRTLWEHNFNDHSGDLIAAMQTKVFSTNLYLEPGWGFQYFNGCGIITVDYYFESEAFAAGCHTNLSNCTSITMGTIPLGNYAQFTPLATMFPNVQITRPSSVPSAPPGEPISKQPLPSNVNVKPSNEPPPVGHGWTGQ